MIQPQKCKGSRTKRRYFEGDLKVFFSQALIIVLIFFKILNNRKKTQFKTIK